MTDYRFYVYVLFDQNGLPFYVGKGRGNRWLAHDRAKDPNNRYKNFIVRQTIKALGEVPKIKIRDGLNEPEAFDIEAAFIRAIGRYPHGPLINQTDNRNGPSSETITTWHASRTPGERKACAAKTQATKRARYTPDQLSEIARKNALSGGSEAISNRMKDWHAAQDPEITKKRASLAGKASSKSPKARAARATGITASWANLSPEQKTERTKNTHFKRFTKDQLSEYGKKGVAKANAMRTPERRRENSRNGGLAARDKTIARNKSRAKTKSDGQYSLFD